MKLARPRPSSAGYSTCVSACRWQTFFAAKLHNYPQTTKQNWKKSCRDLKKANPYKVAPGVLIPRPETAELCEWVVSEAQNASQLLDIGTGSGCIAITLAAELPHAKVSAWDISDDALRIASGNASLLGANVTFEKHDILDTAIATDTQPIYDVIVSNPPYIKLSERDGMAKNVRDYEPDIALFAPEANPIIFYQKIAHFAWKNLREGGRLFFELNPLTSEAVGDDLRQLGFSDIEFRQDLYGKQRFLKATKI